MKKFKILYLRFQITVAAVLLFYTTAYSADSNSTPTKKADSNQVNIKRLTMAAVENWRDSKFGLMFCWGPASIKGTEISWSRGVEVPKAEYDNLYKQFKAEDFNAANWVSIAKNSGAKYIIFAAKHHDGFCMWDTKLTDYNIMKTPLAKDVLGQLAGECKKEGILFGVSYSICDWHHPDCPSDSPGGSGKKPKANIKRYLAYVRNQLKEIITGYDNVSILWFDGHWEDVWPNEYGTELYKYVKSLKPAIIVNNRLNRQGQQAEGTSRVGDFDVFEQEIGQFESDRPTESCITLGTKWSWKPNDKIKTSSECIESLVRCSGNNGNFLLDVGPMSDGTIEPKQVQALTEIGDWLKKFDKSVYGTRGGPLMPGSWGVSTNKDNTIFLHVLDWPTNEKLVLPAIAKKIVSSKLLTAGKVNVEQSKDSVTIQVPKENRQQPDTIIELELEKQTKK